MEPHWISDLAGDLRSGNTMEGSTAIYVGCNSLDENSTSLARQGRLGKDRKRLWWSDTGGGRKDGRTEPVVDA